MLNTRQLSMDVKYVSDRCRELRKSASKSQYDMSELTGMSYNTVSRIETEQRVPDIEQLLRYCYALNVPITDFLPPDVQVLGMPKEAQALRSTFSQLSDDNKRIILSTMNVLVDGLLAQQQTKN